MALTLPELHERLADPNKDLIIGPDGTRLIVDKSELEEAFTKGYRSASPEERQNELWHKEFGEGIAAQTAAGAAGVLRGVSFGLSDPAMAWGAEKIAQGISSVTGMPIRDDITAGGILGQLKQQNPEISTGSEIGGAVIPAVFSGGAGALGTAARGATISGRVASIGRAAEAAVAERILALGAGKVGAGLGKRIAAEVGGGLVGGGLEGGLFGAGNYVSKWALEEEPDFTAEGLINHMGTGALLGGATDGLLGGAKEFIPAAIRSSGNALFSAIKSGTDTVAPNLGRQLKDLYANISSARTGIPADDIKRIMDPPTTASLDEIFPGPEGENIKRGVGKLTSNQKDTLYENIYKNYKTFLEGAKSESDVAVKSVEDLRKMYDRYLAPDELKVLLKKATPQEDAQLAQTGLQAAEQVNKNLEKVSVEMGNSPDIYLAKDYINNYNAFTYQFGKRLDDYKKIIAQDPTAFSADRIYSFLTNERKILDNIIKYDKDIPANQMNTIGAIKEARRMMKDTLVDTNIWGEPIARVQEVNGALNEYLSSLSNFKAMFGKKLIKPDGTVEYVVNPGTIKSFFSNPNSANNIMKKQVLKDLNEHAYNLMDVFNNNNMIDRVAPLFGTEMGQSLREFAKGVDQNNIALDLLERDRLFGDIKKQAEAAGILEYLPLAGWAAGGFGGISGTLGAALLRTGKDPAMEIQATKAMWNIAQRTPDVIGKAVKELGDVTDRITERLPVIAVKEQERREKNKKPVYREYSDLAKSLQNDPELLNKNLLHGLSEIEAVSPLVAGTMRDKLQKITQFIISKVPKSYAPDPLRPNLLIEPSYYEKAKFERYIRAINKPLTVFEDMSRGQISPEGIEVLKELYPAIYQKFYEISLEHIAEGKVSRKTRLKLQNALNINSGDINMYQATYEQQKEEEGSQSQGRQLNQGDIKRTIESETY